MSPPGVPLPRYLLCSMFLPKHVQHPKQTNRPHKRPHERRLGRQELRHRSNQPSRPVLFLNQSRYITPTSPKSRPPSSYAQEGK
ncbi:hypothetical protein BT67DRAFT_438829 [Trichocladium antarcticum]|uniref:Uncharacterized protein n=1 Tax=Trichocladium antarcticum TaxID=1450529 RepID=A0AAN6UR89_9PEZI|nr:hypothetical protein BT67DRAFT_438829 [Trichocladium antarcticum]